MVRQASCCVLFLFFFLFITIFKASSQTVQELKGPFMDIMLSFPSGFESIKGEAMLNGTDKNRFYAKVRIPGTQYCALEKNDKTGKFEYVATINTNDEWPAKKYEEVYQQWKKLLDELDFNGAPLKEISTNKYSKPMDIYYKGTAWRLSTNDIAIDPKFASFTVRLEFLDLDQGGLMLQVLVTDN